MAKKITIIVILFLIVRILTTLAYKDTYYYYGMVANQFEIADASYYGHDFSFDSSLGGNVMSEANKTNRYIPIEDWKNYPRSNHYTTFPAQDLPGFGYLIAWTSKMFSTELTSRYAFAIQIFVELLSLLMFLVCISWVFGNRVAFIAGLLYIFAYPFIWPLASQPMRDIFVIGVYSSCLMAFFLFIKREGVLSCLGVMGLIIVASILLWVRPSGYYFFFITAPFALFFKNKKFSHRIAFVLASFLIPMIIFGYQFKQFNIKYYGVADTSVVGRGMWEGMGIIKDNPYGFVLDDGALVPWVKSQGYDYAYSSPEMNKLLGSYAKKVIDEDPSYYIKTVLKRIESILILPLSISPPFKVKNYGDSELSFYEFYKKYPMSFAYKGIQWFFSLSFFYLGLLFSVLMFKSNKGKRLSLIILLTPFIYSLSVQIPIHFETRGMAVGAWVLVIPFAYYLDKLINSKWKRA